MSYWDGLPYELQHRIKMWALMKEIRDGPDILLYMRGGHWFDRYDWFWDKKGWKRKSGRLWEGSGSSTNWKYVLYQ